MAGITVRDLGPQFSFGSVVDGVTYDTLADESVRGRLKALFEDRGLIVFENVEPSQKMHVAISDVFGPLKDHPTKTTARVDQDSHPGVIDMHSKPAPEDDDTGKVLLNGRKVVRYSPWHFDHCYNDELNRAGVLRVLVNSPEGGRTGFADGVELYESLSPELRERIDGLNVIYELDVRLSKMRFGRPEGFKVFPEQSWVLNNVREGLTFPRAMHPAVWSRDNGDKVLHVGAWMAFGLEHHEDPEGEALLEAVCQEINEKANGYWHNWKDTDMVIWDNWRMLHAVEGNDPQYERRSQRTTIKGDYGLGYFEGGKKIGDVQRELVM
ncbi:MAG: TauD/TfdA family dioxygenase [Rhizobiaceae bacterium]|nr:MAG: TauD/TfdA family dioxygenase [Rhizobiaceae bacterium]